MTRGTVCWVDLEPADPPELGKVRPAVVVSNSAQNEHLDSVVVVPLSSRAGEIWPLRLAVACPGLKPSFAVVPGLRQVAKIRLRDTVGIVDAPGLARLDDALRVYLGD